MKKILLIVLLLLTLPTALFADQQAYGSFPGVDFQSCYDGDTFKVTIPYIHPLIGEKINIRVASIDTPEIRGHCIKERVMAHLAKAFTTELLISSNRIDLLNIRRGKYYRIVADVQLDQGDLATLLMEEGLAVAYEGGTKKSWCSVDK